MTRPCDNCTVNLVEAMLYDEVTCFKTCEDWREWQGSLKELEPTIQRRRCEKHGKEPHLLMTDGTWLCLRCRLESE